MRLFTKTVVQKGISAWADFWTNEDTKTQTTGVYQSYQNAYHDDTIDGRKERMENKSNWNVKVKVIRIYLCLKKERKKEKQFRPFFVELRAQTIMLLKRIRFNNSNNNILYVQSVVSASHVPYSYTDLMLTVKNTPQQSTKHIHPSDVSIHSHAVSQTPVKGHGWWWHAVDRVSLRGMVRYEISRYDTLWSTGTS